jgi:GH24 family phage-related lysozyme (muramidase)
VNNLVSRAATPNQFSAMVDFAYNEGAGALAGSTALREFNAGNDQAAADAFLMWDEAGGQVLEGLERRRQAERTLFLTPG